MFEALGWALPIANHLPLLPDFFFPPLPPPRVSFSFVSAVPVLARGPEGKLFFFISQDNMAPPPFDFPSERKAKTNAW